MTCRAKRGFPVLQLSQLAHQQTVWRISRALLERAGQGEAGLRTDSSHLDSKLGSGCFQCLTLSKLLNHFSF